MASGTSLPIREWMQPIEDADLFVRAVGGVDGGPVLVLAHGGPGLSNADRLVLTGQGHLPWIECPDLFYPAVRAFMARIIR